MNSKLIGCVLFFAACVATLAQQTLNNDTVVKMVKSGLGDGVIISMIQSEPGAYTITPDTMIALKQSGVSDAVLSAMAAKGGTAAGAIASADPNDPLAPHESGIYLLTKDREGKPEMIPLERAAYSGAKTGGMFASAVTYGIAKVKTKAVIPGPHASIRDSEPSSVFYFYFEDKAAGLGKTSPFQVGNLSSPNQFALVKLQMNKNNRETVIGEFNSFEASSGTDSKDMVQFKSERIRSGVYKVNAGSLQPGEYCFLAAGPGATVGGRAGVYGAGAAAAADIFDFGVGTE